MSNYKIIYQDDYLEHFEKDGMWKKHKYISRYKTKKGKWAYVYKKKSDKKNKKVGFMLPIIDPKLLVKLAKDIFKKQENDNVLVKREEVRPPDGVFDDESYLDRFSNAEKYKDQRSDIEKDSKLYTYDAQNDTQTFYDRETGEQTTVKDYDPIKPGDTIPPITEEHTADEDLMQVNPGHGLIGNRDQNCAYCTMTYDLRRRGLDVIANQSTEGRTITEIRKCYTDPETYDYQLSVSGSDKQAKKVFDAVSNKLPDGARGDFSVMGDYGGHSMIFEKENGKLTIKDAQTGMVYTDDTVLYTIQSMGTNYMCFTRMDNTSPNLKYITDEGLICIRNKNNE